MKAFATDTNGIEVDIMGSVPAACGWTRQIGLRPIFARKGISKAQQDDMGLCGVYQRMGGMRHLEASIVCAGLEGGACLATPG